MLFTLAFDVALNYFYWCTACCEQTETLAPKVILPKFLTNRRKFFLQEAAACALVGTYEFTQLTFGVRLEKNMDMVFIMIPFL